MDEIRSLAREHRCYVVIGPRNAVFMCECVRATSINVMHSGESHT